MPAGWHGKLQAFIAAQVEKPAAVATRASSQQVLHVLGAAIPEMLGGSADLTGSNNTNHKGSQAGRRDRHGGNYIHYGVREFGMSAIMNGIALHGGFIPYGGTFLVFSDYARNACRMAALMKQRVVYVFTHDSIGLGEDGPTHQPVEHVASLRLIPNMNVWRPCDTVETAVAWGQSIAARHRAHQPGPDAAGAAADAAHAAAAGGDRTRRLRADRLRRRARVRADRDGLRSRARGRCGEAADRARVAAFASSRCRAPACSTRRTPRTAPACCRPARRRVAIEAGSKDTWWRYVGLDGAVVGMDTFGASAPAKKLFEHFGFTAANVAKVAAGLL